MSGVPDVKVLVLEFEGFSTFSCGLYLDRHKLGLRKHLRPRTAPSGVSRVRMVKIGLRLLPAMQEPLHIKLRRIVIISDPSCGRSYGTVVLCLWGGTPDSWMQLLALHGFE